MRRFAAVFAAFLLSLTPLSAHAQGSAWVWGNGYKGQLGNGEFGWVNVPAQISGFDDVVGVAGGTYHSVAVKGDGRHQLLRPRGDRRDRSGCGRKAQHHGKVRGRQQLSHLHRDGERNGNLTRISDFGLRARPVL